MNRNSISTTPFWRYVRDYLTVYLPKVRGLSPRTADSYRHSLALFCTFLKETNGVTFLKVSFEHIRRELVLAFLRWLQEHRHCKIPSCNLRLCSLKSFLKYCADVDIGLYAIYQEVKNIPLTKTARTPVGHLSDAAFKALLAQPDTRTAKGIHNRMIIMLLYDTGTRVQELVDIMIADLHLQAQNTFITVTGRGNKTRNIPLMDRTVAHLKEYLRRFHAVAPDATGRPLFYSNRSGMPQALSTDAVSIILKNYGEAARKACPEVPERVHPHLIRHTRAMHLYRSGMPLSYIAEFLGHASMTTTEIYATAGIEMLRGALEKADPEGLNESPAWKAEESLKRLCGL